MKLEKYDEKGQLLGTLYLKINLMWACLALFNFIFFIRSIVKELSPLLIVSLLILTLVAIANIIEVEESD